ncbi:MAG TPA: polysaccharide biosynthesis/export family protein [Caulobacteraceae bacterium]|jgi:polysaccharide export outer membrane protein|nr:polysaccharide biosynthesis/export family protein [Caulobacteraceae bacterium]
MRCAFFPFFTLALALIAGPVAAAPAAPPAAQGVGEYVLGPADVVEVDLLGQPSFTTKDRVTEAGNIRLPMLGEVKASDLTAGQLGDEVASLLVKGGFFTQPIVKVDIVSYGSRYVTMLGNFRTPGLVPVDHPYRLSEMVARAGGLTETGADYVIYRPLRGQERQIKMTDLATGEGSVDPEVSPGDKIYAPQADLVFVSGEVKAPGAFPLTANMTIRMALARAGGVNDQGTERRLTLSRHGVNTTHVNLDDTVQPSDVIKVGERLF